MWESGQTPHLVTGNHVQGKWVVCDRLFGQTQTTFRWRRGNDTEEGRGKERVGRAGSYDDNHTSLFPNAGVRLNRFHDNHVLFITIGTSYRTPMDRGAGCLPPEDFVAPLEAEVAGDFEEPLWVDALGLLAFTALMRNASN